VKLAKNQRIQNVRLNLIVSIVDNFSCCCGIDVDDEIEA
jgi:hypothetical protein